MVADAGFRKISPQQYLAWEQAQPLQYEYINGIVYAMTGGNLPHNDITLNLDRQIYPWVR